MRLKCPLSSLYIRDFEHRIGARTATCEVISPPGQGVSVWEGMRGSCPAASGAEPAKALFLASFWKKTFMGFQWDF